MDLNQLLYRRLSQDNLLNGTLSKYADKPAIFNTEFPPDQQEGWNGKSQYPRISYVFNKQVDTKRSSSGQLTVALYDIMDPLEVEKIEVAIRNCLQDVVMKPEGEAPMCFAWARSEPYILEGNAVLCKEIVFDILEYPAQETTDPDPVMALNRYIKNLFPECIVFGIDELSEYTIPADTPVFYSGLKSIDSTDGHCRSSLSWFNAVISVHLLCPKPSLRLKMMAALHQSLAKDEEIIMEAVEFQTLRTVTFTENETMDLAVEAVTPGVSGNVPANTITIMASPINGVTAITNSEKTSGGAEEENDEDYYERIHAEFQSVPCFKTSQHR